jgi:hypothetical protein
VGDFHASFEQADLVERLDVRGQTTVDAENFAFNDGANAEVIEHFCAVFPAVSVAVLADGFVVEAVDGCDLARFVVTAQQRDAAWVLELQTKEQLESLDGVVAAVHEVTHKDVASVRDLAAFVEQLEQIVELSVDIAANCDWGAYWLHIALFDQDFFNLFAEHAQVAFWENSAGLHCLKPRVDVRLATHSLT